MLKLLWTNPEPTRRLMYPSQLIRWTLFAFTGLFTLAQSYGGQLAIPLSPPGQRHSKTNIHELQRGWKYDQRAYPLGYIPQGARSRAVAQIQAATPLAALKPHDSGGGQQRVSID